MCKKRKQNSSLSPKRRIFIEAFKATILSFCALFSICVAACDGPTMTENDQIEVAEKAYQKGDYTTALNAYEAFLKHYRNSPLAPVARQRILTINREVAAVMRRKGTPPPEYMKKTQP